jgi:hypothetical protein
MADKEIEVQAGPISPKTDAATNITGKDMADWCKFKIQLKQNGDTWTYEVKDKKDGKLSNWKDKGANDKWNFEDDSGDKQNCMIKDDKSFVELNAVNNTLSPRFTWSKPMWSPDTEQDFAMNWNSSLPLYWRYKVADLEKKGSFDGLFLDDPLNPTLSGAKALMAGVLSSAALVYATMA